jgi:glycyl-tRNA synthetase (class II)
VRRGRARHVPLAELEREIRQGLKEEFATDYDQGGAIGCRYRRQDEVGTPFCVTVDRQTKEDNTVTVRSATRWSRSASSARSWRAR